MTITLSYFGSDLTPIKRLGGFSRPRTGIHARTRTITTSAASYLMGSGFIGVATLLANQSDMDFRYGLRMMLALTRTVVVISISHAAWKFPNILTAVGTVDELLDRMRAKIMSSASV